MNTWLNKWKSFPAGLYVWIVSISLGATLLDIIYTRSASAEAGSLTGPADFLLLLSGLTMLTGVIAIGFSWGRTAARNLLGASFLLLAIELFTPMLFGGLITSMQAVSGLALGMWIRLVENGLASFLAVLALVRLNTSK
jgi:hypothetical protein